jgi:23S rRNA-/tRNA-specific pseudouridylate synthase
VSQNDAMSRNSKRPRQKPPSASPPPDRAIPHENPDDDEIERRESPASAVLHRDDHVIVLDKPSGVTAEEVVAALFAAGEGVAADALAGAELPLAVYPLDTGASGVLLAAGDAETRAQLERQIADGALVLSCMALVRARPGQTSGTISRPLLDNSAGGGLVRVDEQHGRPAVTEWRLIENYIGFALLECIPRTRIACQIRSHLQAEGMPLVVDPRYGGGGELMLSSFKAGYRASRRREERPLICRLTLHARLLTFTHPVTGKQMHFESPPPKDMRAALHQLDRFGRMAP